ncbi:DUF7537 family lipoprotein [Halorientalis litorea]|uniref:DUF7537 family lipoprotein n=1 Tax=Halorientalis litorea TaxID=2931977 RepID=UPI001FF4F981|nr:hypothetical protein [Halorientalis litorea]
MVLRSLGVVALACCLVLAGCNAIESGGGTPTVTPAPVPTDERAVPAGGAAGSSTLATRHATVLAATNYTVVTREYIAAGNRTLRVDRNRREVARGGTAYSLQRERKVNAARTATVAPRVAYWYNGTLAVARTWATEETSYHVAPNATGPLVTPSERATLARFSAVFELTAFEVTTGTDEGGTVLRSTRVKNPAAVPHASFVERPRNASVVVRVTEAGHVSEYRYTYEGTVVGMNTSVRVVRQTRFVAVGETDVTAPEWVERAD